MKKLQTIQKKAVISIIENENAFTFDAVFQAYDMKTARKMAYSYIKRICEPANYYHHKPVLREVNQNHWTAKVTVYGNVTIVDKDGTEIYHSEGLDIPIDNPVEPALDIPIESNNQITVKIEKDGKKINIPKKGKKTVKVTDIMKEKEMEV